jgi:hypothetical protein
VLKQPAPAPAGRAAACNFTSNLHHCVISRRSLTDCLLLRFSGDSTAAARREGSQQGCLGREGSPACGTASHRGSQGATDRGGLGRARLSAGTRHEAQAFSCCCRRRPPTTLHKSTTAGSSTRRTSNFLVCRSPCSCRLPTHGCGTIRIGQDSWTRRRTAATILKFNGLCERSRMGTPDRQTLPCQ